MVKRKQVISGGKPLESGRAPAPAPEGVTVRLDGQGNIDCDVLCSKCRYNLRGVPIEVAKCPECGALTVDSIDQYKRFWFDERWMGAWCAGLLMLWILMGGGLLMRWVAQAMAIAGWKEGRMAVGWLAYGAMSLILVTRRHVLSVPIGVGGQEPAGPDRRWLWTGLEVALLAALTPMIYIASVSTGRPDTGAFFLTAVLISLVVTAEQWRSVPVLLAAHAKLNAQRLTERVWAAYIPALPVLLLTVYAGIWITETEWPMWVKIVVGTLAVVPALATYYATWVWLMLAMKLMTVMQAAIWTRARGRERGVFPGEFAYEPVRMGFMQRFLDKKLEKGQMIGLQEKHDRVAN
jgi:hypothetical protein